MQALSPTHSPYGATNARNQIRNKSALESRGSGAASFLDYTLLRVDIVLPSLALFSTMLLVNKCNIRDISIIADLRSKSAVPNRSSKVRYSDSSARGRHESQSPPRTQYVSQGLLASFRSDLGADIVRFPKSIVAGRGRFW